MKVKVYAKLNLSLNVVGVNNGYHLLDALTTSVNLFDVVQVTLRNDGKINVEGMDMPQQENVAYKAAKRFFEVFGGNGCDIKIDKGIPFSQGLGGSSADASATVYCLAQLLGVALDDCNIKDVCDSVGSDVYFMLRGGFGKIVGRSDIQPLQPLNIYGCLTLFNHKSHTASVFKQFDAMPTSQFADNDAIIDALLKGEIATANELCFNALQQVSSTLSDYADSFVELCTTLGVKATMTGSGSAYFVLCPTAQCAQELAHLFTEKGFTSQAFKSVPKGVDEV